MNKNERKHLNEIKEQMTQEYLMTELAKILPGATFLCEENNV